jgi:hypothetical protein
MTVPVPLPTDPDLAPPDHDEVVIGARAKVTAVRGEAGLTEIQRSVLHAHIRALTGVEVDLDALEPMGPEEYAQALARRTEAFRIRQVQTMLLAAFVLQPVSEEMVERIRTYARELNVDEHMIDIAHEIAHGGRSLAMTDFTRGGYHSHAEHSIEDTLHVHRHLVDEWDAVEDDPELASLWSDLGHLPSGSLGRLLWEFYRARGFSFPGTPGSAPPLLAQHDFVHVIADYGSTVESEIEVFGLIARADDDTHSFALLAGVLCLFETGVMPRATIFEANPHHLSNDLEHMTTRLADAMRRGATVGAHFGGRDLLSVDWFAHVHRPIEEVRELIGVPPKSAAAIAAGSVGPWEPGGISEFQIGLGRAAAAARGEEYDAHGASVR